MDTSNDSFVAISGENVLLMTRKFSFTKEEALRCAAWMVAIADENNEFPALLEAVRNT